jgi:hypothetical protein
LYKYPVLSAIGAAFENRKFLPKSLGKIYL